MQAVIRFCQKEIHIALTPCMHIVEAQQILLTGKLRTRLVHGIGEKNTVSEFL
jgi:hypothetical protein